MTGPAQEEILPEDREDCMHCGHPAHYDWVIEDWQHDDPSVPDCFLIRKRGEASN